MSEEGLPADTALWGGLCWHTGLWTETLPVAVCAPGNTVRLDLGMLQKLEMETSCCCCWPEWSQLGQCLTGPLHPDRRPPTPFIVKQHRILPSNWSWVVIISNEVFKKLPRGRQRANVNCNTAQNDTAMCLMIRSVVWSEIAQGSRWLYLLIVMPSGTSYLLLALIFVYVEGSDNNM